METCGHQMQQHLPDILAYLSFVLFEHDWLNDFAANVPTCGRNDLITIGHALANLLAK
jgi:hypothetical protein